MPSPETSYWYWLGDGMIGNIGGTDYLQIIFHEWHKFGPGLWDFEINRLVVATFSLSDLTHPIAIDPIPSDSNTQWGAGLLPASMSGDGYTYIYGVDDSAVNKKMRIARVAGSDLSQTDQWQYLNTDQQAWMRGETEATDALSGIANEYSVTPWHGDFALVSQDTTEAFSARIRVWSGCDPYGPFAFWVDHDQVYYTPEAGPYGTYGEEGKAFTYNAHVHPTLASGDTWTLSYNVNSFDSRVSHDGAHYRAPASTNPGSCPSGWSNPAHCGRVRPSRCRAPRA
ncbi:hypothetical protein AB5J56_39495 [Streptomyces sp. R21]|uniref:DUF4185 domain-containing protein n=1 Tax=Streptomyces sp. R21 TaxID=3238627 RepID=A0AB39PKT4_9ACTN